MSVMILDKDYSENCLVNCGNMVCTSNIQSQKELLLESNKLYGKTEA